MLNQRSFRTVFQLLFLGGLLLVLLGSSCTYMKMLPPADIDKRLPADPATGWDNTCWMATAANMLAGAGYGTGTTVEARSEDIYADMVAHYGKRDGGWIDSAISWWLSSTHNTWGTNPYQVVTVYGNKNPKNPWANANGSQFIANSLRKCHFVGLSISWPVAGATVGSGGHAITSWGDNMGNEEELTTNSINVRVTDSDRDTGGDVQPYGYDSYTSPNPGGANEGNGWYINYDNNHPYIKHICVLSPLTNPGTGDELVQKVLGSYRIYQSSATAANGLEYTVGTDVNILSYRTWTDWTDQITPTITESSPTRTRLDVDWDFTTTTIPRNTWVEITTEFMLPAYNAIWYRDVAFRYPRRPDLIVAKVPDFRWKINTPLVDREILNQPNITGGYVVASMEIVDPNNNNQVIGEYRLIHEYSFTQNPEFHTLELSGEQGYQVRNIQFGHSYGYLMPDELWNFQDWMTESGEVYDLSPRATPIEINWQGRLPYPEGENIRGRIPKKGTSDTVPIDLSKIYKRSGGN